MGHDKFLTKSWLPKRGFSRHDNESYIKFANSLGVSKLGVDGRGVFAQLHGGEKLYISSLAVEDANRTIYVETTGNDTTGDGSATNPYATPVGALRTIKKIISEVSITIQLGAGTFEFDQDFFVELSELSFVSNAELKVLGDGYTDEVTGLTLTPQATLKQRFDVVGDTFDVDEYVDYFVTDGSKYYPIIKNGTDYIDTFIEAGSSTKIVSHNTTINITGDWSCIPSVSSGRAFFQDLAFDNQGVDLNFTGQDIYMVFKYCLFTNLDTFKIGGKSPFSEPFLNYCMIVTSASDNGMYFNGGAVQGRFAIRCDTKASHGIIGIWTGLKADFQKVMIRNATYGLRLKDGNYIHGDYETNNFISFHDCDYAIALGDGCTFSMEEDVPVYLDTVGYTFYQNYEYVPTKGVRVFATGIAGTPTTAELHPNIAGNGYVNPEKNWYIITPNTPAMFERGLSANLTNNDTTNIVVGDKTKHDSIFIKYTITRDDEVETNTLQISNNGTAVAVGEGTLTGQDAGVTFAVAYDGDDIQLQVTLDDDEAGTMKYNVERTIL